MLKQTIDSLIPLLSMLPQPVFCLRTDGSVHCNQAARYLAPPHGGDSFSRWLGEGAASYEVWDRAGTLDLAVVCGGQPFRCSIQQAEDGILCLLSPGAPSSPAASAMTVTAQALRQSLGDLSTQLEKLENQSDHPAFLQQTAAMQRQVYRMTRIASNLSDLGALQDASRRLHTSLEIVPSALTALAEEITDLCWDAGRKFLWKPSEKSTYVSADWDLVQRALLNLVSNAIKYSPSGTPIALRSEITGGFLLLQLENVCDKDCIEPLHSAFRRLEQRSLIPDVRWGIGLGLPIAQAIAQLHGGMVALEIREHTVVVTLSLRCQPSQSDAVLRSPGFSYSSGMRQSLIELSDILPTHLYHTNSL